MEFRTIVDAAAMPLRISYTSPILLLGSCFAENIGQRLHHAKFEVLVNPFGIVYNPISLAQLLARLCADKPFVAGDLYQHGDIWLSFLHHGRFSSTDRQAALEQINEQYKAGVTLIRRADFLIITLGTMYYYCRQDTGQVVSNCHKLAADFFVRRAAGVDEVVAALRPVLGELRRINPTLKFIFTLSPVRHWKDGAVDNHYSKSVLMVATRLLCEELGSDVAYYFPAYEIMTDDLRDYRFYEADMLHPNTVAIAYIWEQFRAACISNDKQTLALMGQIEKIRTAMTHRPHQVQSEAYKRFRLQQLDIVENLAACYPYMDWSKEKLFFSDKENG